LAVTAKSMNENSICDRRCAGRVSGKSYSEITQSCPIAQTDSINEGKIKHSIAKDIYRKLFCFDVDMFSFVLMIGYVQYGTTHHG
jgi:hypothetical protein